MQTRKRLKGTLIWNDNTKHVRIIGVSPFFSWQQSNTVMPTILQTLQAFNTPLPQADKYIFIYDRLTVVLFLEKEAYPENSHNHVQYCHIKANF